MLVQANRLGLVNFSNYSEAKWLDFTLFTPYSCLNISIVDRLEFQNIILFLPWNF